jgi:hypothetical protein
MMLASPPGVFIGLTVVLFGGAAFLTGQALAGAWRPVHVAVVYSLLLGAGNRFLVFALFKGELLSFHGYALDSAVIMAICVLAWRITLAGKMVSQYPWLYERRGPFAWRAREDG